MRLKDITLEQALELERLVYKSNNENCYELYLIKLLTIDHSILEYGGAIVDQSEQTTVTKRERRIFDLDIRKLKTNCLTNTPSNLYLNFFQHIDYGYQRLSCDYDNCDINRASEKYINWLENETGVSISALGTGQEVVRGYS